MPAPCAPDRYSRKSEAGFTLTQLRTCHNAMKQRPLYLVFILAAVWLHTATVQANNDLVIYTEQYPPYNMSMDGRPFAHKAEDITGLCTDMVKSMLELTSLNSQIKMRAWSFGLDRVSNKPNRGLFCVARTPEREKKFLWVGPLTDVRWTLFAKPGSDIKLKNLDDAKKYRLGGYKGSAVANYMIEKGFNISVLNNDRLNPKRLMLDQIDLWAVDELTGPYLASDASDITGLKKVLVFNSIPMYLALNLDTDPSIIKELMRSLKTLNQTGQLEAIERTYGR